jgi:antitoxin component YwqK of YwqJK toxin-antitoxin module
MPLPGRRVTALVSLPSVRPLSLLRPAPATVPLWATAGLVLASIIGGCRQSGPVPAPQGYLFEKGPYQGFYDPNGKLMRLLYDQNGDKKADVVMLFYPNGRPRQVEADTDFDGKIDRWQYYSEKGAIEKQGFSRRGGAKPDTWEYFDARGNVVRREIDDRGDGQIDRVETFQNGALAAVGIDGDGDGKIERWQTWAGGRVVSEEIDTDADGIPDRRLRYGKDGRLLGVDVLERRTGTGTSAVPAPTSR